MRIVTKNDSHVTFLLLSLDNYYLMLINITLALLYQLFIHAIRAETVRRGGISGTILIFVHIYL